MPQLQTVSLKDRASTPANWIFQPRDIKDGVGTVVNSATGIPVGNKRLSVSCRQTASGSYKSTVKLAVPVVVIETINGVQTPKVVRTAYANAEFTFDSTSTSEERNNVVGMFQSSFDADKALVNGAVVMLEGVY